MRKSFLALALCLSVVPAAVASPRPYFDLDFELPECTNGWLELNNGRSPYENRIDASGGQSGQQSYRVRYTRQTPWVSTSGYGGMYHVLPMNEVAGRRLKLGGFIRSEGITAGFAGLWILVVNQDGSTRFAEMSSRGVRGTTPWTYHEVELDVPLNASWGYISFVVPGNGTAWFDNLSLEVDGTAWKQGKPDLPIPAPGHVNWVRQQAIPVTSIQAGNGFADLQPLQGVIGDARIVSLGEATHGTKEFFQMKHRLLEFLVTEMGFTHFSIEANMPEAYKLNDYVLTGQGDPAELLEGMYFWTWNTQEVLDMVQWMRAYNASGRGPVQFTGFDAQITWGATDNLRAFFSAADPAYLPTFNSAIARIEMAENTRRVTAADLDAARGLFDYISSRRSDYLASFSAEHVDWMIQNARVIGQVLEGVTGITPRDESMAENVGWILDHAPAGSKIVLWAHNGHVNKKPGFLGDYLDQRYGDDMYVLGFNFREGRYNAYGSTNRPTSQQAHLPVQGSLESLLDATGLPRFILDLRHTGEEAPDVWFRKPRLAQTQGSVAFHCGFSPSVAAEEYDGLIWIDSMTPSVLLPFD